MRRHLRQILATVVLATMALAGCSGPSTGGTASAETRTFTADNGEITIPAKPQRIVATGYAVPVLIEAKAPLVGISEFKRSLPLMAAEDKSTYDGLTKIAGELAAETNYEAIAQAKPDLIIIGVPRPVQAQIDMERLNTIAPVVAIGPSVPSAWKTFTEKQADAAGAMAGFQANKDGYLAKAEELKKKYAGVLANLKWGHLGGYGDVATGNFQREFADSWGTNIAQDIGVQYYGQVKEKTGGSGDVSENPAIEELGKSFAEADYISYTVQEDGTPSKSVQYVLNSQLWKNLPQVKAGKTIAFRYTEASTYKSATKTLETLDTELAPLLKR
ncbi:MAG: ABC transporter substrate-binding protein [Micropruina sp.]|nr:ABC transporter substrate-binding protein [Micropruina sp.]